MTLISINEDVMREMMQRAINEKAEEIAAEKMFWTMKELEENTNLCVNTIKIHFFYDPEFPKFKVGATWRFPVKQTKEYLEQWGEKQIKKQRF